MKRGHDGDALASDVINVVLPFIHAVDVCLQADLFITRLGNVNLDNSAILVLCCAVLMDPKLQTICLQFVEHIVVIFLFGNFCAHFEALLHKILLDDTQDFVLLQSLPRDVQRKILGIHVAHDKIHSGIGSSQTSMVKTHTSRTEHVVAQKTTRSQTSDPPDR